MDSEKPYDLRSSPSSQIIVARKALRGLASLRRTETFSNLDLARATGISAGTFYKRGGSGRKTWDEAVRIVRRIYLEAKILNKFMCFRMKGKASQ